MQVSGVAADRISYTLHGVTQPGTLSATVPYSPQPCGLLSAADGVALGWQVASVWVVAWGAILVVRAMWATFGADNDGQP